MKLPVREWKGVIEHIVEVLMGIATTP